MEGGRQRFLSPDHIRINQDRASESQRRWEMPSPAGVTQAHAPPEAPSRLICEYIQEGLGDCPVPQTCLRETETFTHLPLCSPNPCQLSCSLGA